MELSEFNIHTLSKSIEIPWPTPMHMLQRASFSLHCNAEEKIKLVSFLKLNGTKVAHFKFI